MSDHKKIFFDILEELDVNQSLKSALLEQIYEINFDLRKTETFKEKRYCYVELIIEKRYKAAVESEIRKLRKKNLISNINKKLFCKTVKFIITEKENQESTLKINKGILQETKNHYEKNFCKNVKYQEVIWRALCKSQVYKDTYSHQGYYFSEVESFPHIPSYLLFPDQDDIKLKELCNVYLYQTRARDIKKFGISNDISCRAKTGGENTYKKYLSSFLCNTRIEALSIEFCLMEEKHKLREFPMSFFKSEQEWIKNKKIFEVYQSKIQKYKLLPLELTLIPVDIFNELVPKLAYDYRKLDPFEFFKKNSPKTYSIHKEAVDNILKQIWSIDSFNRLIHQKNKTDFESIYKQFNNTDKYESADLFDWSEE